MHIAIAGNIGAGKTTLTTLLAKHYKWHPHFEDADDNPYLNDFYEEMQRWSFNLQVYFLNSRFGQVQDIRKSGKTVIQDRTIYEDAYIFAPNLHAMGLMTTRDFENYFALFKLMESFVFGRYYSEFDFAKRFPFPDIKLKYNTPVKLFWWHNIMTVCGGKFPFFPQGRQ